MNERKKLIFVIYIFIILLILLVKPSYAGTKEEFLNPLKSDESITLAKKEKKKKKSESADDFIENITESADDWTKMAQDKAKEMNLTAETTVKPFLPMIASSRFVAQAIIFIFGFITAIKWRMGTPEERAKSYHSMLRWVIGAIIVIAGIEIWGRLMLLGSEFSTGEESGAAFHITISYIKTKLI